MIKNIRPRYIFSSGLGSLNIEIYEEKLKY